MNRCPVAGLSSTPTLLVLLPRLSDIGVRRSRINRELIFVDSQCVTENIEFPASVGNSILVIEDSGWIVLLFETSRNVVSSPFFEVSFHKQSSLICQALRAKTSKY